ncbi:MAG: DUF2779 domain-containing protein [Pyrinomonadaceae bacterium]|nr:DUF2779 domain-containing protein [Pyrinomonadaceae bacterium]
MSPEQLPETTLTKTDFKLFLECPREFWLKRYHPEQIVTPIDAHGRYLIRQGYEVEREARALIAREFSVDALESQYTVTFENLLARFDILRMNDDGTVAIYEVKSSKHIPRLESAKSKREKREKNLYDLAFQVHVARLSGLVVSEAFLVTLDGDYVRGEDLEIEKALHFEDVTEEVTGLHRDVQLKVSEAMSVLQNGPGDGFEGLCKAKLKCAYFVFAQPELPETTIFDIPRISDKRIESLRRQGVLAVEDVPGSADLTGTQMAFVEKCKNPPPRMVDIHGISAILSELEYPLHFLDYETVNPALPKFRGMRPYEQVTFQYSVHVVESEGSEPIHYEYLSDGTGDPQSDLLKGLREAIGDAGSVISWNKSFEIKQNELLGRLFPEYAEFIDSLNARMFDLADPFRLGLYFDPAICGWSIKNVLPVLVPGMNYDDLDIGGGAAASALWYMDVFEGTEDKQERMKQLREYCSQDTLAMVKIFEVLR